MNGPLDGTQERVGCQLEEDEFLIGCSCISSLGQLGSGLVMEDQDNPRRGKESLHWRPNRMSARRMKKILNLTQQSDATVEIPNSTNTANGSLFEALTTHVVRLLYREQEENPL